MHALKLFVHTSISISTNSISTPTRLKHDARILNKLKAYNESNMVPYA